MVRVGRVFISALLLVAISGCGSIHPNQVNQQPNSRFTQRVYVPSPEEWSLDNFRPDEGTILVDGLDTEIAIDMRASGRGWYEIRLSHDNKPTAPYEIEIKEDGTTDVQALLTPKWLIPVHGLSEEIIIT